jgi:hypothetical protein
MVGIPLVDWNGNSADIGRKSGYESRRCGWAYVGEGSGSVLWKWRMWDCTTFKDIGCGVLLLGMGFRFCGALPMARKEIEQRTY